MPPKHASIARSLPVPSKLLLLLMAGFSSALQPGPTSELNCAANCLTCWVANDPTKCMSCTNGKYLMPVGDQNYQCLDACTGDYTGDPEDMVCKRTMRPYDNPCEPGTFN